MDTPGQHLSEVRRTLAQLASAQDDHRRAIVAAWTSGASVRQLAAAAGVTKSVMHRDLQRIALGWRQELPSDPHR